MSGNAHADCIQGDCENGYGVYEYSDAKYEGNYKKGKFSGYGKYTWYDDGNVYIGEFKKNKPHQNSNKTDNIALLI